ncbi:uncharacterized protein ATNIH1004_003686 [Aspergillus tanneri]|uniref:Transcription factor PAP1 domain-containing protein n=1 Tax=Aspergillus tanneri TaxID=1220188 RepID=A0A5M9MV84_9EURO|nr:uncharacterized protein ATNIH1004_003686 [Aspergillus tanneri]KAA8650995.1 hypothetical protein ATNIH1004_003686 [Aspergillus tanneri]
MSSTEAQDGSSAAAQDKRRAQLRAAQQAYRERQEQRLLRLNQTIGNLEETNTDLHANNKQLELEIAKVAAENEVLLATFNSTASATDGPVPEVELATTTPLEASRVTHDSDSMLSRPRDHPVHRLTKSETGEKLLDKAAAWDMIQNHELFKEGLVDIDGVRQKLEGVAQCGGEGVVFEEGRIRRAIEESLISDS